MKPHSGDYNIPIISKVCELTISHVSTCEHVIIMHITDLMCNGSPCASGYFIHPEPRGRIIIGKILSIYGPFSAIDKPSLEIYTWYMTKENYYEMRKGIQTEVIVPLFQIHYDLYLYGSVNNSTYLECSVETLGTTTPISVNNLNLMKYPISASASNSGVYAISCLISYYDRIEGLSHNITLKKSLMITFIKGQSTICAPIYQN